MINHLLKCSRCPDRVKEDLENKFKPVTNQAHALADTSSEPANTNDLMMSDQQKQEIHSLLAKAIYVTGTPLSIVEHPLWQKLFFKIQPAYKLPNRKAISTKHLENTFKEMNDELEGELMNINDLHLQLDGWTDINNAGIINFMISKPEPVFVKSVSTQENHHTAEYLKEEILKVMSKYEERKFVVLIGDNARNIQRAFQLVKQIYPYVSPLNCAAHTLNLLCHDIMQPGPLKGFVDLAVEVVKTVKRSQILTAVLQRLITERNRGETLKLPTKTRWSSHYACLKSLENTKSALKSLAIEESLTSTLPTEIRAALLDDNFWQNTQQSLKILEPVSTVIALLQSNECNMVNVFITLKDLKSRMEFILPDINILNTGDRITVINAVNHRISMCIKPIHLAAHLLDPRSLGNELNEVEEMAALEFINEMAEHLGIDVMPNLANFKSKQGIMWGKCFVWRNVRTISPIAWWKGICGSSSLSKIACRILTAPCTSAAVERSFSTYGNIHTRKRNRLTTERASKLAFISYNWNLENANKNENGADSSFEIENESELLTSFDTIISETRRHSSLEIVDSPEPSTSDNIILSETGMHSFLFMDCRGQYTDSDGC